MSLPELIKTRLGRVHVGAPLSRLTRRVSAALGERRKRRSDAVFTAGVIALAAKMAKADGVVLQAEIDAFLEICDIPQGREDEVSRLFNLAKSSVAGFDGYARQLGRYFAASPETLENVLEGLLHIAESDGAVHDDEAAYLREVARRFDLADHFERRLARRSNPNARDPYAVLGLNAGAGAIEIKRRYRELAARNHPDMLIARGVPQNFIKLANDRLAEINAAYAELAP